MKRITLQQVQGYIRKRINLRKALQNDYRENRILSVADLEACIYHHLRAFLEPDKGWRVFARPYVTSLGRYPDLAILEGRVLRLAIELKKGRKSISGKDRRTLNNFLHSRHRRKAYFISTVRNKRDYEKLGVAKTKPEKNRLMETPVSLDLNGRDLARFQNERKSIRLALK